MLAAAFAVEAAAEMVSRLLMLLLPGPGVGITKFILKFLHLFT
jgi:hypothetical protein